MNQCVCYRILKAIGSAVLAFALAATLNWPGDPALAQPARQFAPADPVEPAVQANGTTRVVVALRLPYASSAVGARKVQVACGARRFRKGPPGHSRDRAHDNAPRDQHREGRARQPEAVAEEAIYIRIIPDIARCAVVAQLGEHSNSSLAVIRVE